MSIDIATTPLQVCKRVLNTVFHQCTVAIAICAIWIATQNYHNPFSWHVILSTLGLIPLMAEAFILFSNDNVWSQDLLRKHKYWIHGGLTLVGSFLLITGVALEINRKEVAKVDYPQITHFTSAHAVTGLISFILAILALASGPFAFISAKLNKYAPPVRFKFAHNLSGQLAYIIGIVSLCLGYYTHYFQSRSLPEALILLTVVTVVVTIWSLSTALKSLYSQLTSIIH